MRTAAQEAQSFLVVCGCAPKQILSQAHVPKGLYKKTREWSVLQKDITETERAVPVPFPISRQLSAGTARFYGE